MFVPQPSAGRSPSVNAFRRRRAAAVAAAAAAAGGNAGTCERLEDRRMMSVSIGADGFTDIGKSGDTRTVYVSSSRGSDSNSGLSSDRPVRSIAKGISLLRDNAPDHLLLKRGDSWNERVTGWYKSGRSSSEPMVFGNYGDSGAARPLIKTGGSTGFDTSGSVDHLAMLGLHFWAHQREPGASGFTTKDSHGIRFVASTRGLLIEDCVVDQYADNVLLLGYFGDQSNVKIRRSIITDSWSTSGKSQGLYANEVNGLTLEENVFDHNGWNERTSGGKATPLSHNAYLASGNDNVVVKGNIFADAASHGLQARAGGEIRDNLFVRNPIHMSFGIVYGSLIKPGGVGGTIDGNVFLDSRTINGSTRGWAMELGNIKGATVRNNIISDDNDDDGSAAIYLAYGSNVSNSSTGVGIRNLIIENNVVHKWTMSLSFSDGLRPGGSGYTSLNDLTIRNNEFQIVNKEYHKLVSHRMPVNKAEESWSNNRYYEDADQKYWFGFSGDAVSLSEWRNKLEPTAQAVGIDYSSPNRDIISYHRSVGGSGSFSGFMSSARKVRAGDWDSDFTARDVVGYIRAGFDKGGTSSSGGTTTEPEPTAPSTSGAPTVVEYSASATTLKMKFSEDVSGSLTATDLKLVAPGRQCYNSLRLSYDKSTNTATWTWGGYYGGTLPDGTWTASLAGSAVKDASGNPLGGGAGFSFTFTVGGTSSTEPQEEPVPVTEPSDSGVPSVLEYSASATTLKMKFSEDVSGSLTATDLKLVAPGRQCYNSLRLSYDKSTNTATWTWGGYYGGTLPDGTWTASLAGSAVKDASGNPLGGGAGFSFTFIIGESSPSVTSGTTTEPSTGGSDDTTPPRVTASSGSRTSVKLRFSENVSASLAAKDLSLKNLTKGNKVYDSLRLSYDSSTNEATWTWPNVGNLNSGTWQAVLPDELVSDAAGNRLNGGSDFVFRFNV